MVHPIFIEARRLGSVVEARVRQMLIITDKRKRRNEMKRMLSLLRYLALSPGVGPDIPSPSGIALGIRSDGELGLWLIYDSPTNIQGTIQP